MASTLKYLFVSYQAFLRLLPSVSERPNNPTQILLQRLAEASISDDSISERRTVMDSGEGIISRPQPARHQVEDMTTARTVRPALP
jgi:hypothetical protein